MHLDDVVTRGILRRVLARENALKMYALGYRRGNAEFAGWLLYVLTKIDKNSKELLKLPNKERASKVMDIVSEASKEWKAMDSETRKEWIEKAKALLAEERSRIESDLKMSEEIEKLAEEAYKSIEELATVVT